jgi:hypothetical protein
VVGCKWSASYAELAKLDEGRHAAEWKGVPVSELLELDPALAVREGRGRREGKGKEAKGGGTWHGEEPRRYAGGR